MHQRCPSGRVFGSAPRFELSGRVVFVTGAARGIGAEVARQAHARGAQVALVGRRLKPLQQLAAQLGEGAAAFQADVRDLDALQRAADATVARFGGISVSSSRATNVGTGTVRVVWFLVGPSTSPVLRT